jgi:prevent-host-death family protein
MKTIGSYEGKTHFARLVKEAERGETVIITRRGRPVAQLGPISPNVDRRAAEEAFAFLIAMNRTLVAAVATLIGEGRRG